MQRRHLAAGFVLAGLIDPGNHLPPFRRRAGPVQRDSGRPACEQDAARPALRV